MDLAIIQKVLEMGFPAVVLILYWLERRERIKVQNDYLRDLRLMAHLPEQENEQHEISLSWNGKEKLDISK